MAYHETFTDKQIENIKKLIKVHGLSHKTVAVRFGVSKTTVQDLIARLKAKGEWDEPTP